MRLRLLKLVAITAGPKLIALLRDLIMIKHYGLGVETATLTTIIYATQFVANVVTPGIQALLLSGYDRKNEKNIYFDLIEIALIIFYLIYLQLYFSEEILRKSIEVMLLLAISMYSSLEMNKFNIKYTVSTSKDGSVLPYAADMLVNVGILIYLIFAAFEIKSFLIVLIAGNVMAAMVYRYNCSERQVSTLNNKKYKIYFGAIVLTFVMSSTNIIDQTLLGYKGESELSLFNIIQRYTFVIAGLSLMMAYRFLGSRVLNIDLCDVTNTVKKNGARIVYGYGALLLSAFLANDYVVFNVPLVSIVISLLQIPVYILYAFLLSVFIGKIDLLKKIYIGFGSLICKYTYLTLSGVSVNQIFVSHFILNLVGVMLILYALRFEMQFCKDKREVL